MDDFPVIVPEDDGFAIYLNDERVDWYSNEADAEGVALSMVDEELNSESFFDRPLEESISNDSDLQSEIVSIINATNDFKAKVDGQYIAILYNDTTFAAFSLDEGIGHSYASGMLSPSSRGDGKNTFRITDVSGGMWSKSFEDFYNNEEQLLSNLDDLRELCRYYTLKTLYDNEFLYGHQVPEEANDWRCAQWGTWKFIINSLDDVKTCIAALKDGFDMAQKKYSTLHESANLKEAFNSPNGCDPLYTGLAYKEAYSNIISSFVGQIWDGIGEGDGREGRIFNYYYKELDYVRSGCINGEFVIYVDLYALDQLIRGIWRVAQIERSDNGSTDKNIYYDYLDANWSDICKLQGTLNSIAKRWNQDPSNFKNEPWSDEKKAANDARIAKAKADAEAKAAAEKKAKEEAEAAEKARFDQKQADIATNIHPDAKDTMRAEDAWKRTFNKPGRLQNLYYQMQRQLDKITDIEKAKRRIVAFYQEALKHSDVDSYDYWIKRFKEKMDRDIDL
jgi:hypothetical protein